MAVKFGEFFCMIIPNNSKIIDMVEDDCGVGGGIGSHSYFSEIISLENLFLAWNKFARGKRNRKDVQLFFVNLEDNLFSLHEKLKSGNWRAMIHFAIQSNYFFTSISFSTVKIYLGLLLRAFV